MLDIYVLIHIFDFLFSAILALICLAFERQTRHFPVDFPIHTRTKAFFLIYILRMTRRKFLLLYGLHCIVFILIPAFKKKNPFFSFLQLLESLCIVLTCV